MSSQPQTTAVSAAVPRLARTGGLGRTAAPVRIAHVGLGNFFRAHQAWYTDRSPDAGDWGIAAFTGRSASLAEDLTPQDGLYTLITRGADGDSFDVVGSLTAVHPATDQAGWLGYLRSSSLSILTLTVTEAGYLRGPDGGLDAARADVSADVSALHNHPTAPVGTAPARLVAGFLARRAAGAGPISVVPCDNLPENAAALARVVTDLAGLVDPSLREWMDSNVSWVTTMVDRITPRTTDADRQSVLAATGYVDAAPVATEPFREWVLSGEFPAGRPRWEDVGARFVSDITPFEERKLWLLNGSHSLLAYAGSIRGHGTVAESIADETCAAEVNQWWAEASRHLRLPEQDITAYRQALAERFANPRIQHLLAQIAADGSQKLPVRILPVLRAERAAGRMPAGAVRVLAAWMLHLRGAGVPVDDPAEGELAPRVAGPMPTAVRSVLGYLDPQLDADDALAAAVTAAADDLR